MGRKIIERQEKSEIPIQNNTFAFLSFLFFSEMYIQFAFLENLFNHMMHKHEERVVISMLFVVGLLFMLIFSWPWRKIKVILKFSSPPFYEYKNYLLLVFFIDL